MTAAVFLDRDGAIIEDKGYLRDPVGVVLLPGAAEGLLRLQEAGLPLIVVTNQSGIARGYYTESEYLAVHGEMEDQLRRAGVRLTAAYHCPHGPGDGCGCRKPLPGLLLDAAETHDVTLERSFMVGDSLRDVEAGAAAGCALNILLDPSSTPPWRPAVPTLDAAADLILARLA